MRYLLKLIIRIPGLRTLVWHSAFLQRIAGYVIGACIPRLRCDPYGFTMVCDSLSPTFLGLCAEGGYEKENAAFIAATLKPGQTFIDIGANEGFYALLASMAVGDAGRVLAIEPDPVPLRCLRRNLEENRRGNVVIAETCVGEREQSITLHTSHVNGVNSPVQANVIGPSAPIRVPCVRLDDLLWEKGIPRPDMIKIDIQGWEFACLRGAEATLRDARPVLVFELWPLGLRRAGEDPAALLEWIRAKGYAIRCLEDPSLNDAAMTCSAIAEAVGKRGQEYGGYGNMAAIPVAGAQ